MNSRMGVQGAKPHDGAGGVPRDSFFPAISLGVTRSPSAYSVLSTQHSALELALSWTRAHRAALVSLLVIGLIYLVALVAMPPQGLTQHDTGAKYLQVRNLRLTPTGIDWSINYPARQLDPQLQFVPFSPKQYYTEGGRIYLQWPIFLGLLTRIPWKVLGFWGLYVVPLLAGLGSMLAAYLLALAVGVPRRMAWLAVPLVGLATPISVYSLLFFEHTLAAMLVTLSLLAAVLSIRAGTLSTRGLVWSALLLAAAIYFRSELYVLALVLGAVYAALALRARTWRPLVLWVGVFLLALVPLWAFYAFTEGNILPLHATRYFAPGSDSDSGALELPALRYIVSAGWGVVPDFLFGPQSFPLSPRFDWWLEALGLLGLALCAVAALLRLVRRESRTARLLLLALGLLLIAPITLATLFSPQPYYDLHGFLLASPFIALALWPPRTIDNGSLTPAGLLYTVALLYVGLHALVISALSGLGPISTHEWGQRYILPAYPALVALALLAGWRLWSEYGHDTRWRRPALTGIALGLLLALAGLGFSVRGYVMLYDERQQVVAWLDLAQTLPDREPLVTDVWWLPLNLAAGFYSRPIMLAQDSTQMQRWAQAMQSKGLAGFGVMTNNPSLFQGDWRAQMPGLTPVGPPQQTRGMWLQEFRVAGR